MRKLIEYFIKYPVAANILIILILILGYMGFSSINSTRDPQVDPDYIRISVSYPGASPEEIETGIVQKIENNLQGMTGIKKISSTSVENSGTVTIELISGYDSDVILQEIKNEVDGISSFPSGMEPPQIKKLEWMATAVEMAVYGDVDLKVLKTTAQEIKDELLGLEGITKIDFSGVPSEEIEILFREKDLQAYGMTIDEAAQAVYAANQDFTGGTIRGSDEELYIRSMEKKYYAADMEDIVLRTGDNGAVILLRDVATVSEQWQDDPNLVYVDGKPAIMVVVSHTNEEDIIQIANDVRDYVNDFNSSHEIIKTKILADFSERIHSMQTMLLNNGMMGFILVLLFLSMFLNKRLSFWVAFSIPLSFMGMFIIAAMTGITLNSISLFGMILVVGILVDDGIVIAENIYQHFERGSNPLRAAIDGALEVLPAVFSGVLTTIIACGSIMFIGGMFGQLFREMAIVVIAALVISLIEGALILPAHIAHSKALDKNVRPGKLEQKLNNVMARLRDRVYFPLLKASIRNKAVTLSIAIGMLLITLGGFAGGIIRMGEGGSDDSQQVTVNLDMPAGTPQSVMIGYLDRIESAALVVANEYREKEKNDDVVESIVKNISSSTSGSVVINICDNNDRKFTSSDMTNSMREEVGPIPEAERVNYVEEARFGKPVSITLLGNDLDELEAATEELKNELNQLSDLKNVEDNNDLGMREVHVALTPLAYELGLNVNDMITQIRTSVYGDEIQRINRGENEVKIWARLDEEDRSSIGDLEDMRISTSDGGSYPLSEIATLTYDRSILTIKHLGNKREITIEADLLNSKANLSEIKSEINNVILPSLRAKYSTISVYLGGRDEHQAELFGEIETILPIMIMILLAVIAFTFRSIMQTLIILLMVPFSIIGIGWGHFIHGQAIDMPSYLGIIILLGVIVNDSIVFINHMNLRLKQGKPFIDSVLDAGYSRFRPILLTSLTTIAGLAPLILSNNPSAMMVIPMAISVAYGLFVATLCTLFILPTLLIIANSIKCYLKKWRTGTMPSREEVEQAVKELVADNMLKESES